MHLKELDRLVDEAEDIVPNQSACITRNAQIFNQNVYNKRK